MSARFVGALLVALAIGIGALGGCGGALLEGKSQFDKGRYPEAKQTFVAAETDSRTWPDGKRAEYALYRGLTHAALGDRVAADLWLKEAKAIESTRPGSLNAEELERLKLGIEALEAPAVATP